MEQVNPDSLAQRAIDHVLHFVLVDTNEMAKVIAVRFEIFVE